MKFFGSATVGVKGQIVIPIDARERFDLKETDKLLVFSAPFDNGIVLVKADSLESMMHDFQKDLSEMQQVVREHERGGIHD